MLNWLVNLLGGNLLGDINNIAKSIFGSKEAREAAVHKEQSSVLDQFSSEFLPRENRTWWDSLVDGLNRLPRPVMTFGAVGLFIYCVSDPLGFAVAMQSLQLMPDYGWGILLAIVGFWFGGKFLSKDVVRPKPIDPRVIVEVMERVDELEEKRYMRAQARRLPLVQEEALDD